MIDHFHTDGAFLMDEPVLQRVAKAHLMKVKAAGGLGLNFVKFRKNDLLDIIEELEETNDDLIVREPFCGYASPLKEANATDECYHSYFDEPMVYLQAKHHASLFEAAYPSFNALVDEYIARLRDDYGVVLDDRRDYETRVCNICGFSD